MCDYTKTIPTYVLIGLYWLCSDTRTNLKLHNSMLESSKFFYFGGDKSIPPVTCLSVVIIAQLLHKYKHDWITIATYIDLLEHSN